MKAQEWLDNNYANYTKREKITTISTPFLKKLEGELRIEWFPNLKKLVCSKNHLTSLVITNCPNLSEIDCSDNLLTNFNLVTENPEKLVSLNVTNNSLPLQDLSFFSKFSNLKELYLGTTNREKIDKGIYNRFSGSLKFLQGLNELKSLGISNTDVDSGLEFLPKNLREVYCASNRQFAKCVIIQDQLVNHYRSTRVSHYYDYSSWRRANEMSVTLSPTISVRSSIWQKEEKEEFSVGELATNEVVIDWKSKFLASQSQLIELNNIICPNSNSLDFTKLKSEAKKLKVKHLVPQLQDKKIQLADLTTNFRQRVDTNLEKILELYLETCSAMVKQEYTDNHFFQGQLAAFQNILQEKLSLEELKNFAQLEKDIFILEKELANLGLVSEEFRTQIQLSPKLSPN